MDDKGFNIINEKKQKIERGKNIPCLNIIKEIVNSLVLVFFK
jgi:hypothetical protein